MTQELYVIILAAKRRLRALKRSGKIHDWVLSVSDDDSSADVAIQFFAGAGWIYWPIRLFMKRTVKLDQGNIWQPN